MSVVRYINYENRLAKQITAPGGKHVEAALADAEEGLKSLALPLLAEIDNRLAMLASVGEDAGHEPRTEDVEAVYGNAREIAGLAGYCGMDEVGAAAVSLCNLLDRSRATGRWHGEGMRVHVATLRLLREKGGEIDPQTRVTVLKRLEVMVEKIAAGA